MDQLLAMLHRAWPLLLLIALAVIYSLLTRRSPARSVARRVVKLQQSVYSGRHEYRVVSAAEFADLDLGFYDQTQAWFESQGFRYVGDVQNVTLARTMGWGRSFARFMVSADGAIAGCCYDIRICGWMRLLQVVGLLPRDLRTVELESGFGDGTFLVTCNTKGLDRTSPPSGLVRQQFEHDTTPEWLLGSHRAARQQLLAAGPGLATTALATLDDCLQLEHGMQDLKNARYGAMGYMNSEELARMAGGSASPEMVQAVAEEIEKQKAQAERGE